MWSHFDDVKTSRVAAFITDCKQNKKLSCRREAARCFVFVCSELQHTAHFLLLVTAASDL